MKIVSFKPKDDGLALILTLENASNADKLILWTDDTYKDYNKAIDLTSLLTSDSSQIVEIPSTMISQLYLNGVYVIQIEDDINVASSITQYSVRYEECILEKLSALKLCDDCLNNESVELTNAQALLNGFRDAVSHGFIEEAGSIRRALDKFCSNDCKSCGHYYNIKNDNYYDY